MGKGKGPAAFERQRRRAERRVTGRQRTVDRAGYLAYLASPEWREVKCRYAASRLPKECYVCGSPGLAGKEFHHRTYRRLGNDRLSDIVPVCPPCHALIPRGGDTWRATKKVRKAARRTGVHRPGEK